MVPSNKGLCCGSASCTGTYMDEFGVKTECSRASICRAEKSTGAARDSGR